MGRQLVIDRRPRTQGGAPITPQQFADWVERSGIKLVPRSWHPISARFTVFEEEATWHSRRTDGKKQAFDQLASDRGEPRRRQFQRAMTDLMDKSYAIDAGAPPTHR